MPQESLRASARRRMELVLARARVFLALAAAICIYIDPTEPAYYAPLAYALLVFYIGVSAGINLLVKARSQVPAWLPFGTHIADIVWLSVMTMLTGVFNSPFAPFFTFVVLSAAYRWGFEETIATAALVALILFASVLGLGIWPGLAGELMTGSFEPNRLGARAAHILIIGMLLGYLAREEKRLRQESVTVAALMTRLRDADIDTAVETAAREGLRVFGAFGAAIVAQNVNTGDMHGWALSWGSDRRVTTQQLAPAEIQRLFFPAPSACVLVRRRGGIRTLLALDASGRELRDKRASAEPDVLAEHRRALAADVRLDEWFGRVFVFDPALGMRGEQGLALLQRMSAHAAPAILNAYLVGRLRSRAEAAERARLARDLHDTSIQSLIALEMELLALTRRTTDEGLRVAVHRIRTRLQSEIDGLRRFMDGMSSSGRAPATLRQRLTTLLAQFEVETGIRARLLSHPPDGVPPDLAQHTVQIIQAALSNVRRHSHAGRVDVAWASDGATWRLTIDDDGTGASQVSQGASALVPPRTIKQRVDALGGSVTVEPRPDAGMRVVITLPNVTIVT